MQSTVAGNLSGKLPVIRGVISEVSQSLRFQWLVSAHRAIRHAGREVTNCTAYMDANGQHSLADKLRVVDADRYQVQC